MLVLAPLLTLAGLQASGGGTIAYCDQKAMIFFSKTRSSISLPGLLASGALASRDAFISRITVWLVDPVAEPVLPWKFNSWKGIRNRPLPDGKPKEGSACKTTYTIRHWFKTMSVILPTRLPFGSITCMPTVGAACKAARPPIKGSPWFVFSVGVVLAVAAMVEVGSLVLVASG